MVILKPIWTLLHTFKLSICSRECASPWFLQLVDFIQKLNFTIPDHISRTPVGGRETWTEKKGAIGREEQEMKRQ